MANWKAQVVDVAERSLATFAQAFLAIEVADQSGVTQISALKVAAVAGAFAVGKYLLIVASTWLKNNPDPAA